MTNKRTFAKKKDAFDELFEIFDIEPSFEVGVNMEALADLEARVPIVARSVPTYLESMADRLAEEIVVAERASVIPRTESTSKGVESALKRAFWVDDVDHETVVNIKKLLADAVRGVSPDKTLSLPRFLEEARESASNLTDARLETIFRTNISTAANEGVMAVLRDPEAKELYPLVMITEIDDSRSREHHAIMDGYITTPDEVDRLNLRPPNGYNCRGSLIKVSWGEADDLGLLDEYGKPDMIAISKSHTTKQKQAVEQGLYPDEGFKTKGL